MENERNQISQKYYVSWEVHQEPMRSGKRSSNTPSKRWGHSVALYRHYLYLFGGSLSNYYYASSQSLYSFDLKSWGESGWDRFLPAENEVCPSARDGHSASVIGNYMYIIGGSKGDELSNEIYSFDFRSLKWSLKAMSGDTLEPREAHVALLHAKSIIVVHGGLVQSEIPQELVAISIKEDSISKVIDVEGRSPGMLESHSCVKVSDVYIILVASVVNDHQKTRPPKFLEAGTGEKYGKTTINSNEMYSLKIEGSEVNQIKAIWTKIEFLDPLPSLSSHLCFQYKGDYLLLIGGECKLETQPNENMEQEEETLLNTVYRLNLKTKRLNILKQENSEFKPRMAHAGVIFKDHVYIFGGLEKGKVFNSQFLRMSIKRQSSEKSLDKLSEAKSSKSDSKLPSKCKFCVGRTSAIITPSYSNILFKKSWPDFSSLETKVKRRIAYSES